MKDEPYLFVVNNGLRKALFKPLKDFDLLFPELFFIRLQDLFENDVDAVRFYNGGVNVDKIEKAVEDRVDLLHVFRNHLLRILSEFRILEFIDRKNRKILNRCETFF